jgi:D-threonate/D-erythronate kinase
MIGVIADDLTGAAEIGGIGLRHGLKAEVILQGNCGGKADLLCVDTDSRSCSGKEAARRATAAARKLREAGAVWIYKKVDSVLRGNVLVEIRSIQKALGLRSALLVPANPCFGRVIRKGRYFVKRKPVHQTDFARDPEYPRKSSNVMKMLEASNANDVAISNLADYRLAFGIMIGEVSSSEDVQEWAYRRHEDMLAAGGAEFFEAVLKSEEPVAKRRSPRNHRSTDLNQSDRRELFVCGSTSDYTKQFVNEARHRGTPVLSIIEKSRRGFSRRPGMSENIVRKSLIAFESHSRVVLAIGRPLITRPTVATQLAQDLVAIAVRVIEDAEPDHVYAEGGATAAALLRQLGWRRMKVLEELAPGVTTLSLLQRGTPLLTIKPGSYPGWPSSR